MCVAAHNSVPPDPTITVDNVTQIFNKIGDKWERVMGNQTELGIPQSLLEEMQRRYSTDTEKNHACADYYVNCHPKASWEDLTVALYVEEEFAAARESKSLKSTGMYILYRIFSNIMPPYFRHPLRPVHFFFVLIRGAFSKLIIFRRHLF